MSGKAEKAWLQVPVDQYEGHMGHTSVRQFQYLSFVLEEQLDRFQPERLLIPGISTGNGLEHVNPDVTRRITGLDIQPDYLEVTRERFGDRLPGLNLVNQDLLKWKPDGVYDLVYCALVLEYMDPIRAIEALSAALAKDGMLVVLLQLPGKGVSVSNSPFEGVRVLEPVMNLVEPDVVRKAAADCHLKQAEKRVDLLKSGKSFWLGWFRATR